MLNKLPHILTGLALFAVILVAASTVVPTASAQAATADFRIIAVSDHDGQLLVEVEHFNADGSFDYFENYLWQGREGSEFPLVMDKKGRYLLANGMAAPSRANSVGRVEQFRPAGYEWKRADTPYLNKAAIVDVIQSIHNQRRSWAPDEWRGGQKRGQSRLTEPPIPYNKRDVDGVGRLINDLQGLAGTAYTVSTAGVPRDYSGRLPSVNPGLGRLEYGTISTFYPGATATDGEVHRLQAGSTFASIRSGAGNNRNDTAPSMYINTSQDYNTTNTWDNWGRGVTLFDTSSLGAGTIVDSADYSIVVLSKRDDFSDYLALVQTTLPIPTTVAATDYQNFGTAIMAPSVNLSAITADSATYNTWTLNASGLAAIEVADITQFGLRVGVDNSNTDPGGWVLYAQNRSQVAAATTNTGIANAKPRLVVTHHLPFQTQ